MIADLNRAYVVGFGRMPLRFWSARNRRFDSTRVLLDAAECFQNFASCIENRWRIAFSGKRPVPRCQQWVFGFHRLRETAHADTFCDLLGR